ncbi:hypothetical protein MBAV_002019, partial [Candidatus Magnetobacterium bavaricum]
MYVYEAADVVLDICGFVPVASCPCNIASLAIEIAYILALYNMVDYGSFKGLTLDADFGKVGTPTLSAACG